MDDTSLQFAQPVWIAVGVVVCAIIIVSFMRFDRHRDADLAKLIHPRFRQRLMEGFSPKLRNLKRGLWLLAVLLIFVAVARPQKGYEWREVKRKGIDILFAVDTSRSMLAEDLTPNRLERARLGIIDFVDKLEGDRVGLIPFAGSAFALCPLTLDYDAFRESLNALDTDLIPRQGTDLASAIKEAERLFDETGNNYRVLVLLTDGEDLQGDVIDAAKTAAKKGMAIYTVGVGSPEGARMPIRLQNGRVDYVRDESGEVVKTKLDENTLKKIAAETNGLYVSLGRGAEGLNTIYQEKLRLVPKTEQEQRMEKIPLERFELPLGLAIALLVLEFFIRDRLRDKKSKTLPAGSRIAKVASMVMGIVALSMMDSPAAETVSAEQDPRKIYNLGTEAYQKGDFEKASQSLRESLRTQDLSLQQRSYYNLANTLYRTGQGTLQKDPDATIKNWEASIKAYQDSLALNSADEDASYNKALVEKKLEELKKQQNKDEKKDQKDDKKEDQEKKDQESEDKENKDSKDEKKEDSQSEKDPKDSKDGKDPKDQKEENGKDPKEGKDSKDGDKSKEEKDQKEGKEPKDSKEKKEGEEENKDSESKGQKDGKDQEGKKEEARMSNERTAKQEMTPEEAKQLLESLRSDERTVIPIQPQKRTRYLTPDNSTNGKTW
ncbi:MAG: VWA domain-containing protein [Akkermansiaceae bacterium]|nr:VWA domain-containing protein [Akkermansiaceae bacterium]